MSGKSGGGYRCFSIASWYWRSVRPSTGTGQMLLMTSPPGTCLPQQMAIILIKVEQSAACLTDDGLLSVNIVA